VAYGILGAEVVAREGDFEKYFEIRFPWLDG
jgi:hypothetical protein